MKLLTMLTIAVLLVVTSTASAQIPSDVELEPVPGVSGLSSALSLKHAGDGSNRLFIVEQGGDIRVVDGDGTLLPTPFVSLGNQVNFGGERGLLDIAFHPEFAVNGLFYLHYSAGTSRPAGTDSGDTIVAEFSLTGDPNVANNTPDRIILTVRQDFGNHNGGGMNFGPDGYLYIGLGDGGDANDPCNRSLTLDPANIQTGGSCESDVSVALLGKMLRLDVDANTPAGSNNLCGAAADGSANYSIPPTNPFPSATNRCGEVFLHGIRNPWRSSFDRETGDLWIGDVGQNAHEEINLLEWPLTPTPGESENLGWRLCEGTTVTGSSTVPCGVPGGTLPDSVIPVIEYETGGSFGRSVTGGYRYRGPVDSLYGRYIFGDAFPGNIAIATEDGGNWSFDVFGSPNGSVRAFGEDEQGNVYVVFGSSVSRFEGLPFLFADGFEAVPSN